MPTEERFPMEHSAYMMLYLCRHALADTSPRHEKLEGLNMDSLFSVCKFHSLTSMVCMALEKAGIENPRFSDAKDKAIRKNILLDSEQRKICTFMEENGINNMPLKGAILKNIYPKLGMRQMADNDILFDRTFQNEVMEFMLSRGYTADRVGKGNHDVYKKPPIYNFELHTALFGNTSENIIRSYYDNVWRLLHLNTGKQYSYHFSDEDFYIYMLAHEYKHYSNSGTGLRSLIDSAVYLHYKKELNFDYIKTETEKLGLCEFEEKTRSLALKIFYTADVETDLEELALSDEEQKMLDYLLSSGTYGTSEIRIKHSIQKHGDKNGKHAKLRYVFHRIFPGEEYYKEHYPFLYRHKIFIPFFLIYRFFRGIIVRRKRTMQEWKTVRQYQNDQDE